MFTRKPLSITKSFDKLNYLFFTLIVLLLVIIIILSYAAHNEVRNEFLYSWVIRLLLSKTLGKGTFGKVKLGMHKVTGEPVAIKILEKSKIKDVTDVERVAR